MDQELGWWRPGVWGGSSYSECLLVGESIEWKPRAGEGGLSTAKGQEVGEEVVSVKWSLNGGPPGGGAVGACDVPRRKGPVG